MRLRTKTSAIIVISVVCLIALTQFTLEYFVHNEIQKNEDRETQDMVTRIKANVDKELETINLTGYSWACWDDTYRYVQDQNVSYIYQNFEQSFMANYDLNIFIFLNLTGYDVLNVGYNTSSHSFEDLDPHTLSMLAGDPLLQDHSDKNSMAGIMALPRGPCLISAWSILHSNSSGPSMGTAIFGRYLDEGRQSSLSVEYDTPVSIVDVADITSSSDQYQAKMSLHNESGVYTVDQNDRVSVSSFLVNDIGSQPTLLISTTQDRVAYQQGTNSLTMMSAAVGVMGIVMIFISLFLVNSVVISRMTRLEDNVRKMGKGGDPGQRLAATGNDEIFSLSQEINTMVESIEKRNQDLRESEERYKAIMEQSVGAIFIVDSESWTIQQVNSAFVKLFGYSENCIPQLPLSALSPKGSPDLENILKRISSVHPVVGAELSMRDQEGRELEIEMSGSLIEHGGDRSLCITAWDVTERHQLERDMARNQKLESLGVLAGGIAHDFNNILTSIVSNIEITMISLPEEDKQKHRLEESVRSAMRAKGLTQQLLTFSPGGQPVKETVDLAGLVRSSTEFVLAGSPVVAVYEFEDGLSRINADPAQMEQVINNLIINSVQAMPGGGRITIRATNLRSGPQTRLPLGEGNHVQIDIMDEGVGIPQEHLDRIFDPFYTTKENGTGLGLSTVRSIVRNHGGTVQVDSVLGKGTTITLVLPAETSTGPVPAPAAPQNGQGRRGRILVMDDEESILEVLQIMLEDFGHSVTCVNTGEKAIAAYREGISSGHPFDLVIMDLTIKGGMGGKETIVEILAIDPEARVIVSSGYSNDPIMAHPKEYGFKDVLMKPFTIQELSAKVSSVMGRKNE